MTDLRPHPPWLWPNTLSLDAAFIAVGWQALFARTLGAPIGGHHAAILGLAVWLGYAGDRWLDSQRYLPASVLTHRHLFYARHRSAILCVWVGVLAIAVALAGFSLSPLEFLRGCILLTFCLAHTWGVQNGSRGFRKRFPKEVSVSVLFCAGVFLFITPPSPPDMVLYAFSGGSFFFLCLANCCLLAHWERGADQAQGEVSIAVTRPTLARRADWLALASPIALWVISFTGRTDANPVAIAMAVSAIALFMLNRVALGYSSDTRRAWADAVLLSPYLALLVF
jgi:hypothetical protein